MSSDLTARLRSWKLHLSLSGSMLEVFHLMTRDHVLGVLVILLILLVLLGGLFVGFACPKESDSRRRP